MKVMGNLNIQDIRRPTCWIFKFAMCRLDCRKSIIEENTKLVILAAVDLYNNKSNVFSVIQLILKPETWFVLLTVTFRSAMFFI